MRQLDEQLNRPQLLREQVVEGPMRCCSAAAAAAAAALVAGLAAVTGA